MDHKTVAFIGASAGVGLSALKHTLAAGHRCIALCRNPSRLTDLLPTDEHPNLRVVQGNAHDVEALAQCLTKPDANGATTTSTTATSTTTTNCLVDGIVSTIGAKPVLNKLSVSIEDPNVCARGAAALLEALAQLRRGGATGSPYIVACSTTGLSRFGRDVPLAMVPLYHVLLKVPHQDKRVMEDALVSSGEDFTIVRCSLLVNGESQQELRVGIEDPDKGRESSAVGYTVSREDAGKWFAENVVFKKDPKYLNKAVTITY